MTEPVDPPHTLRTITMLMRTAYSPETDAWRDFVAECQVLFKAPSAPGAQGRSFQIPSGISGQRPNASTLSDSRVREPKSCDL
jgi:hypothetical protein